MAPAEVPVRTVVQDVHMCAMLCSMDKFNGAIAEIARIVQTGMATAAMHST